jgi:hypothetical protein
MDGIGRAGRTTASPGPTVASSKCASASLAPNVTMASRSGSSLRDVAAQCDYFLIATLEKYASVSGPIHSATFPCVFPSFRSLTIRHG